MPMSNQFLSDTAFFVFCAATPLLLGIRFVWPKWMPWLLLLALALIISWGAVIAANYFYFESLTDQINQYESRGEDPPKELRERWASDASSVGVLFFGWGCMPWRARSVAGSAPNLLRKKNRGRGLQVTGSVDQNNKNAGRCFQGPACVE